MILYGVRWEEVENNGFTRSEFVKPEEAISKAKELKAEGKFNVNIKLVDSKTSEFKGELSFE
jgi:hypothetical protein